MYALNLRRHHPTEPRWRPLSQLQPLASAAWRQCLLDTGSLTERLLGSGDRFSVQVLSQGWERPRPSERQALRLAPRHLVLVREVLLWVDQKPRVYGRSVIPVSCLGGPWRHLRRLNDQSLGTQLFRHAGLRRDPFELAMVYPQSQLPAAASQYCGERAWLWGRRSRFSLGERKLLVSEVFLPAFRL